LGKEWYFHISHGPINIDTDISLLYDKNSTTFLYTHTELEGFSNNITTKGIQEMAKKKTSKKKTGDKKNKPKKKK
jgi:hypothetical protein